MTKMAKVLLVLAIVCLVLGGAINIGWINSYGVDALYIVLPTGAVFFGLFLIVRMLEREAPPHEPDQHVAEHATEEMPKHDPETSKVAR